MADRYRKKPVVIEAIQYRGDNLREVLDFTGKHPRFDEYAAHVYADRQVFKIFTLEGTMEALPGDWIIKPFNVTEDSALTIAAARYRFAAGGGFL